MTSKMAANTSINSSNNSSTRSSDEEVAFEQEDHDLSLDRFTPPNLRTHQDDDDEDFSNSQPKFEDYNMDENENSSSHIQRQPSAAVAQKIAQRETIFVKGMRLIVLIVLIIFTVLAALGVYYYTSNEEKTALEDNFEAEGNKVLEAMAETIDLSLTAVDSFVVSILSYAHLSDSTWPFVTVPDWERRAGKVRTLSKSVYLAISMVVEGHQREEWENYTANNNAWVNESIRVQTTDKQYTGPIIEDFYVLDSIHAYNDMPVENRSLYMPYWQASPSVPRYAPYNWDLLSYHSDGVLAAFLESQEALIGESYNLPDPNDAEQVAESEIDVAWYEDYVDEGQDASEPVFDIYYPILDVLDQVTIENAREHKLLGAVLISIYWRDLLENILPYGSDGIVIVFDNPCTPSFTFQVNGPHVVYHGRGDLHDPAFDEYMIEKKLLDLDAFASSSYAGIPINKGICPHSFRVYSSKDMQDAFVTNRPIYFTVFAVLIFLVTSAIFVGYDRLVEYRQTKVMNTATKASAIVSSLYPENVRDRLFQQQDEQQKLKKEQKNKNPKKNNKAYIAAAFENKENCSNCVTSSATIMPGAIDCHATEPRSDAAKKTSAALKTRSIATPSADSTMTSDCKMSTSNVNASTNLKNRFKAHDSPPIADLFLHTTIFFADISGFTKWSAQRTPIEVFQLLETLFAAFDKIAKRRRVFKVETIGDCYVAVTGIPKPQDNHAVTMVKFARDCIVATSQITNELCLDLGGSDTRELEIRIGLHSGPTTAGVLRGEKGRFQLFGDTVNTASRMESTGVKGQIHCSQATADELISKGKGDWLIARAEKIEPKGKGEMQTYFVKIYSSPYSTGQGKVTTDGGGSGCDKIHEDFSYYSGLNAASDNELNICGDDDDDDNDNMNGGNL